MNWLTSFADRMGLSHNREPPVQPLGYNPATNYMIRDTIPVTVCILWGYDNWYMAYYDDAMYIATKLTIQHELQNGVPVIAYTRASLWQNGMDGARRIQHAIDRQIVLVQ